MTDVDYDADTDDKDKDSNGVAVPSQFMTSDARAKIVASRLTQPSSHKRSRLFMRSTDADEDFRLGCERWQ
jgi:hypothetical protein